MHFCIEITLKPFILIDQILAHERLQDVRNMRNIPAIKVCAYQIMLIMYMYILTCSLGGMVS